MDFTLSSYFNAFDAEKDYSVDISDLDSKLDSVTNQLANNPDSICSNGDLLEDLVDLSHSYKTLDQRHQKQLAYLVTSSFNSVGHQCNAAISSGDFVDSVDQFRASLERYGYLMFVLLTFMGKEDYGSSGKSRQPQNSVKWKANCLQIEEALDAVATALKVDLSKIFTTTPEKNAFVELFMRPIFHLMESPERMKILAVKLLMFKDIAHAVKFHGHGSVVKSSILQSLTYYVHLPPYMAELLNILDSQYDYNSLTEELLLEISQIQFNSNDSNGPRAISEFLIKLSELSPRLILKQLASTAQLLDNSNQTLRCSVVETCGNIVVDMIKNDQKEAESADEHNNNTPQQIEGLLNLLQERFLDQNPYVRTKAIQAINKVFGLKVKLSDRRNDVMLLAVRSLHDKSTLVRRNAIKLMYKLLLTNPFTLPNGDQLSYELWKSRLDEAEAELNQYLPKSPPKKLASKDDDAMEVDDEPKGKETEDAEDEDDDIDHEELNQSMIEQELHLPDRTVLVKAKLTVKYFLDAVVFVEAAQKSTEIVSKLLFSKNRNEVLEVMDFLVLANAYDVKNSAEGIRRMLHLVWMKGSSDEGKSIATHLIDSYKDLFLSAPQNATALEAAAHVAKNLIELTYAASLADLASLEKLLGLMYEADMIFPDVIKVLWKIYSSVELPEERVFTNKQAHGAIIILGMLAQADHTIILKGFDSLLRVGLGEIGRKDFVLCKYSCIAIQRIIPSAKSKESSFKVEREDELIAGLRNVLLEYNEEPEWYSVADHAINAIYQAASEPEMVCSDLIKEKTKLVFSSLKESESQVLSLSQLLFIVGHVAIKTIVHLEKLEAQFKKKKHEAESLKKGADNAEDKEGAESELEMIGGTTEDDFTDAVIYIKEREILYAEDALLAKFGPMVREICSNNRSYDHETLQRSAVLCMGKLMCVSSKYCEDNLPLLITIMEKSPDPIIRSNCVLGLGDMAVCFNNLVDENTDFLYRRLTDDNIMVQRTCLMTVTFLILAGQVKVKGQLSLMAKCLENPDQGISDMCRLFFTELATKDNAIYNGFIDIFSGLSNDELLSKESMKRIVKFLVGFIDKEKHQKQLADKLLVRLSKTQTETQWNDVAFVLGAIPYKNDNITQALEDGYKTVLARQ